MWIIAIIAYGVYYLSSHWTRVENYFYNIPVIKLIFAAVFLICGKVALVFFSKFSIERENTPLTYFAVFSIVTFTQLAKYLPGGIWHFVGRFGAYSREQMSIKKTTRALIIENAWLLSGALMVGVCVGALSQPGQQLLGRYDIQISWVVLESIALLLWFALLVGFERLFHAEKFTSYIKIFGLQWIAWLCLGISFVCILPEYKFTDALFYISIFSFGWLAGYVMVFAPGGIGVRELAIVWMLSGLMKSEDVFIYSTVHRFLFIVVELLLGGVAGLMDVFQQKYWDSSPSS
jgi:uncharacterized membrane protein YbhN (UPF0104 family)